MVYARRQSTRRGTFGVRSSAKIAADLREAIGRIARFSIVGVLNTIIDIGVFFVLVWWVEMPLIPANLLAFGAAVANSYVFNRSWTFKASIVAASTGHVSRFVLLSGVGVLIATGALWLLQQVGFAIPAAKLLSIGVGMTWNYLTMRHLVFSPGR